MAGPSEILEGGRYGDLVPVDSVDELTAALTRHFQDPSILQEKARAARENAEAYSTKAAARAYLDVFEGLIA